MFNCVYCDYTHLCVTGDKFTSFFSTHKKYSFILRFLYFINQPTSVENPAFMASRLSRPSTASPQAANSSR